jgi:hypothetical protein
MHARWMTGGLNITGSIFDHKGINTVRYYRTNGSKVIDGWVNMIREETGKNDGNDISIQVQECH